MKDGKFKTILKINRKKDKESEKKINELEGKAKDIGLEIQEMLS